MLFVRATPVRKIGQTAVNVKFSPNYRKLAYFYERKQLILCTTNEKSISSLEAKNGIFCCKSNSGRENYFSTHLYPFATQKVTCAMRQKSRFALGNPFLAFGSGSENFSRQNCFFFLPCQENNYLRQNIIYNFLKQVLRIQLVLKNQLAISFVGRQWCYK